MNVFVSILKDRPRHCHYLPEFFGPKDLVADAEANLKGRSTCGFFGSLPLGDFLRDQMNLFILVVISFNLFCLFFLKNFYFHVEFALEMYQHRKL